MRITALLILITFTISLICGIHVDQSELSFYSLIIGEVTKIILILLVCFNVTQLLIILASIVLFILSKLLLKDFAFTSASICTMASIMVIIGVCVLIFKGVVK